MVPPGALSAAATETAGDESTKRGRSFVPAKGTGATGNDGAAGAAGAAPANVGERAYAAVDPDEVGFDAWQGVLARLKVGRNLQPLEAFVTRLERLLQA